MKFHATYCYVFQGCKFNENNLYLPICATEIDKEDMDM